MAWVCTRGNGTVRLLAPISQLLLALLGKDCFSGLGILSLKIMLPFIKCILCSRHSVCYCGLINPYSNPLRWELLLSAFYREL